MIEYETLLEFFKEKGIVDGPLKGDICLISESKESIGKLIFETSQISHVAFGILSHFENTQKKYDYILLLDVDGSIDLEQLSSIADETVKPGGYIIATERASNISRAGKPVLQTAFARLHLTLEWDIQLLGRSEEKEFEQQRHNSILIMRKPLE